MYLALDVHYGDDSVAAACVGFRDPRSEEIEFEVASISAGRPATYEPGRFYRRELPYLLPLVQDARARYVEIVAVVDGYVWLGDEQPGLGYELHAASGGFSVIGVAKSAFRGAPAVAIQRGHAKRPLFVTSVGIASRDAAEVVRSMHGQFRIPTLLRRVDHLARAALDRT